MPGSRSGTWWDRGGRCLGRQHFGSGVRENERCWGGVWGAECWDTVLEVGVFAFADDHALEVGSFADEVGSFADEVGSFADDPVLEWRSSRMILLPKWGASRGISPPHARLPHLYSNANVRLGGTPTFPAALVRGRSRRLEDRLRVFVVEHSSIRAFEHSSIRAFEHSSI